MIIVLGILFALSMLALVTVETSDTDMTAAGNLTQRTRAFLAAEAGMARVEYIFKKNPKLKSADSLVKLMNADTLLPNAYFKVGMDTTMPLRRVRATGFSNEGQAAIQVIYLYGNNPYNIWNNVIFAGHGQNGITIKGNVGIHGSVHILGDGEPFRDLNNNGTWDPGEPYSDSNHDGAWDPPLTAAQSALDMTGTATVSNNYNGLSAVLASRVVPLPTTSFGGETVQTIQAELRVQHGNVALDGNAKVGQPNVTGGSPAVKETMDGVYVNDGWTGSAASAAVFSDNGYESTYDMQDGPPEMPDLDGPYTDNTGTNYPTYMAYLKSRALVIPGDLDFKTGGTLPYISNGLGSISLDASGNLVIKGIVYVTGDIKFDVGPTGKSAIQYDGKGMLVSEKDVEINVDVYAKTTFPTRDLLGIVAHGSMEFGTGDGASQLNLQGAYFAQEEVINGKQNKIMGACVSNSFGMEQVPDLYQVPSLAENLPPDMPGAGNINVYTWRRVPRSWVELN